MTNKEVIMNRVLTYRQLAKEAGVRDWWRDLKQGADALRPTNWAGTISDLGASALQQAGEKAHVDRRVNQMADTAGRTAAKAAIQEGKDQLGAAAKTAKDAVGGFLSPTRHSKFAIPASILMAMLMAGIFGGSKGRSLPGQLLAGLGGAGIGAMAGSTRGSALLSAGAKRFSDWQKPHTNIDLHEKARTGYNRLDNWLTPKTSPPNT